MNLESILLEKSIKRRDLHDPIKLVAYANDTHTLLIETSPGFLFPNNFSINVTGDQLTYWALNDAERHEKVKTAFIEANEKAKSLIKNLEEELYRIAVDVHKLVENEVATDRGYFARKTSKKFGI